MTCSLATRSFSSFPRLAWRVLFPAVVAPPSAPPSPRRPVVPRAWTSRRGTPRTCRWIPRRRCPCRGSAGRRIDRRRCSRRCCGGTGSFRRTWRGAPILAGLVADVRVEAVGAGVVRVGTAHALRRGTVGEAYRARLRLEKGKGTRRSAPPIQRRAPKTVAPRLFSGGRGRVRAGAPRRTLDARARARARARVEGRAFDQLTFCSAMTTTRRALLLRPRPSPCPPE